MGHTELVIGRSENQLDNLSADDILRALCQDVDLVDIAYLLQEIAAEKNLESVIVIGEDIQKGLIAFLRFYLK